MSATASSSHTRLAAHRAALVILTAIVVVLYYAPAGRVDYVERWGGGTFGASLQRFMKIENVIPGGPAARAGIRNGDKIVMKPLEPASPRFNFPLAGESTQFTVEHDGVRRNVTLTADTVPFTRLDALGGLLALIPGTIFLIVAFMLVYARPGIMTWAFFVFSVGYFGTAPSLAFWMHAVPSWLYLPMTFVLMAIFGNISVLAILPFALRFPDGSIGDWRRKVNPFVWIIVAGGFALSFVSWFMYIFQGAVAPYQLYMDSALPLFALAAAMAILWIRYRETTAREQQRLGFVMAGFVLSFASYAAYFLPTETGAQTAAQLVIQNLAVLMPICVAYAALRTRVLDINFVLNRAIVYSGLSLIVIALVSLLDWLASRILAEQRLTTAIELLVTIGIGLLLDRVNRTFSNTVDRVFFRRRHEAEKYLRRAAAALPYSSDERAIADGLMYEPVRALDLSAAALYRRDAARGRYYGIGTSSETIVAPPGFDDNDALVRFLRTDEEPVWLDQLRAASSRHIDDIYVVAIPVTLRHEIVAIVLYGAHRNGAQLDPEEMELLRHLAHEAAHAYDHVEAERARELVRKLQATSPGTA